MAFVVSRRDGRFEIRESVSTEVGPRARTLAAFRVLTNDVVAEAAGRARRPFDSAKIRSRARELGAPVHAHAAAATASRLLAQLRAGDQLPPALADELRRALSAPVVEVPDTIGGAVEWVGTDDATRGRVLFDLLDFAEQSSATTPAARFVVPAHHDEEPIVRAAEPRLPDKVSEIARVFAEADVPFAFGGALALAYYAEPRATIDVDVNVFVPPDEIDRVSAVLGSLGISANPTERKAARRDGQVRLWWGITPVDLFFAYDAFHYNAAERIRRVPFGDITIVILAAEDLLVCKVVFDRTKDWIDIDQMLLLTAGSLDIDDVRDWVVRIVGAGDPRVARLDQRIVDVLGATSSV